MNKTYKLGSLFDGSGGFPLAGALCGIEPVWASEVEPYPIAVTKTRFPHMKHLGDISKINGAEIEPVDIITFGSPCQDLSVAGKRAGLKHEDNGDDETTRSGLFIEAVRIIKEMREKTNGEYPRFAVWENVPGAFSSNKGEDFRIVLEELVKVAEPTAVMPPVPQFGWAYADSYCGNGWSLAYRVLDAQYWGVPQRRRRIYLVADFRGGCAREILFEREGLRGYFTQGRTPWKATPSDAERSLGADDREGEVPYTLKIRSGVSVDSYGKAAGKGALIQKNLSATLGVSQDQYLFQPVGVDIYNTAVTGDVACPLTAEGHTSTGTCPKVMVPITYGIDHAITTGGNCTAQGSCVYEDVQGTLKAGGAHAVAYGISAYESNAMKSSNPHSGIYEADTSRTLDLNGGNPACNQGGIVIVDTIGGQAERGWEGDIAPTLKATHYKFPPCVAVPSAGFCPETGGNDPSRSISYSPELSPTLRTGSTPGVVYGVDAYNQSLTGDKAKTLNSAASDADHVPCAVYAVENHPADSRVDIDESGKVQTLTSRMGTGGGNVPMVMEPFVKSRRAQTADDATTWKHGKVANTLNTFDQGEARANELIVETIPLEGNGQRPSHRGDGYAETDKSYTLNATEVHGVAYSFDPGASRDVGDLFIEECGKTLTNGTCPGHHDGVVVAITPIEQAIQAIKEVYKYCGVGSGLHIVLDDENIEDHHIVWCLENSIPQIENDAERQACEVCAKLLLGLTYSEREQIMDCYWRNPSKTALTASKASFFMNADENIASTLVATDYKDPQLVCYEDDEPIAIDRAYFNQGQNALYDPQTYEDGTTPTLVARGPSAVATRYIVRRLTPTECARLQGFADRWGDIEPKTEFFDEEYKFWLEVRHTYEVVIKGKDPKDLKDYNHKQMLTWYNKLPVDSAEYKMWGNGIALPTALYVIQGVTDALKGETT